MKFTFAKYLRNYTIRVIAKATSDIKAGTIVQLTNGVSGGDIVVVATATTVGRKYLVAEDYKANSESIVVFVIDKEDILTGFADEKVIVGGEYEINIDRITNGTTNKHVKILSKGELKISESGTDYVDVTFSVIGG